MNRARHVSMEKLRATRLLPPHRAILSQNLWKARTRVSMPTEEASPDQRPERFGRNLPQAKKSVPLVVGEACRRAFITIGRGASATSSQTYAGTPQKDADAHQQATHLARGYALVDFRSRQQVGAAY